AEGRQARSGGCPRAGYSAQPLVQVGTGWRAQGGPSLSWQWATQGQPGRVVCAAARECAAEGRERDFKKSGGVLRARIAVKYAWITAQSGYRTGVRVHFPPHQASAFFLAGRPVIAGQVRWPDGVAPHSIEI